MQMVRILPRACRFDRQPGTRNVSLQTKGFSFRLFNVYQRMILFNFSAIRVALQMIAVTLDISDVYTIDKLQYYSHASNRLHVT